MKPTIVILASALTCSSFADTIRLRNGTEYEGEVLAEEDDHYLVRIQVTKSIRDERKIQKTEILEIVEEKKDEAAFEQIKDLVPTPDLLTLDEYEERTKAVEDFIAEFPKSRQAKKAASLLEKLDEEREIVAAGGIKFEGNMIKASDRQSRAFPLDARIAASKVTRLGDARNFTGALRAWSELESDFGTSRAYIETIPYAQKLMSSQIKSLQKSVDTFDERLKKREDGLALIDERDRERTKRLIDSQSKAYEAKIAKEKEEGIKWPSLDPFHKQPMTDTLRKLEQEFKKLERLDTSTIPDGDDAWDQAWKAVGGTDHQAASSAISAARSARLPAAYIEMLEARMPAK